MHPNTDVGSGLPATIACNVLAAALTRTGFQITAALAPAAAVAFTTATLIVAHNAAGTVCSSVASILRSLVASAAAATAGAGADAASV